MFVVDLHVKKILEVIENIFANQMSVWCVVASFAIFGTLSPQAFYCTHCYTVTMCFRGDGIL